jgi:hypothetical protein
LQAARGTAGESVVVIARRGERKKKKKEKVDSDKAMDDNATSLLSAISS